MRWFVAAFVIVGGLISRCMAGDLPDTKLTPGVIIQGEDPCAKGFTTKSVRNVPTSEKRAVYRRYHIGRHRPGDYEVDHLISLELGGSNDIRNLWPQSYLTRPWNAHVKDRLENYLHRLVCTGKISLADAQYEISHDWIKAYKKYLGDP